MKIYNVKIKFFTDYLQARFTDKAKEELENYISKGIVKSEEDSWRVFLYKDEGKKSEGIYIPSIQFRHAIVNASKQFKVKKQRSSMKQWATSNIIISPSNIYLGKQEPDSVLVSWPARKDGQRVVIKHPVIKEGTEVEFKIKVMDDSMEDKAIENLVREAGKMYGIGARRADMFGRFEVISFKKDK